ncbi:MAG: ATPase [Alphaproteobacteria bacterium]|nr:ATPase [Alphaproteobacteria bacterium]
MNKPKHAAMQKPQLKRFYEDVAVEKTQNGWQILLDKRPIRTPEKHPLIVPTQALAEAVAKEWEAQKEFVLPDSMFQMQFSCAAIDYAANFRNDVEAETLAYITTDLLCYRASEPPELVQRQNAQWNTWLHWFEKHFDVKMVVVMGIMPAQQSPETIASMALELSQQECFLLTATWLAAKYTGSLILAMALIKNALPADEAFKISRLEEQYQTEQWGDDEEAHDKRVVMANEICELGHFISLLQ